MSLSEKLNILRTHGGPARTLGLDDATLERFAASDPHLVEAVDAAVKAFQALREEEPELLAMDEQSQAAAVQAGMINFYAQDVVNPYVSLAARGPWIVTLKGAVLYECGGYGMLGFGHAPEAVLEAMGRKQVMANVMTPNLSQKRLVDALNREIGHTRGGSPYNKFFFLNSGSESVTLAARISDINAKLRTDPGGPNAGQPIRSLGLKGAFHGRTQRPARFSDSTLRTYTQLLASFRDMDKLITVQPNDIEQLEAAFRAAEEQRFFIEALFMEPVMGEGNPGLAVTPEFYARARELTRAHGTLLLVDSVQAGLRAHGVLSVVDYPGFEDLDPPDMETFSKAIAAGQYPLSVLAVTPQTAAIFKKGVYGNTMTANPRAMDVGVAVLKSLTPELRQNVRERGAEMVAKLESVMAASDGRITGVQGTGLLISCALDPSRHKACGAGSLEEYMRFKGVNVVHGGANALRYTPHFQLTSEEVDLMVEATRDAVMNGPVKVAESASEAA